MCPKQDTKAFGQNSLGVRCWLTFLLQLSGHLQFEEDPSAVSAPVTISCPPV